MLAYLGDYQGLADFPTSKLQGFKSWILWRSVYFTKLGSWRNRLKMNSPCLVFNLWSILSLCLLATSAWRVQNGVENWGSTPRGWYAPNTNTLYQRSFYGPKHDAPKATSAVRSQNGVGNGRDVPRGWYGPNTNYLYQRSFYGPKHDAPKATSARRLQNGIGNARNLPRGWYGPNTNYLYQRSFYGPKHDVPKATSAGRPPNGVGNGRDVPRMWNAPKTNPYQRPFYGPRVGKTSSPLRIQNGIGNARNRPRDWNAPKTNPYQRPFYGPKQSVGKTSSSLRLQNAGIGNGHNGPRNWNAAKTNLNQNPFYGSNQRVGKTYSPLRNQNAGNGNGQHIPRNWNGPKANPHQRPFYGPNHKVGKPNSPFRFQNGVGSGRDIRQKWNTPNPNLYQRPSYGPNHKVGKTSSPLRVQNGFGNGPNIRRNWIPPKANPYQMPFYGPNYEAEKTIIPEAPMLMQTSVVNTPLGRTIAPRISQWLSTVQRSRVPHTGELNRSPIRALVSTPEIDSRTTGLTAPRLTSDYRAQEYAIGRKLEPLPSQSPNDVYNTGDVALQTVLSNVSPSNLIPESVSNQRATSRTGYIETETEDEQTPVPRKSYVASSYIRKESRLNDPKLIKLRYILPNLKKRNLNQVRVEDEKQLAYSMSGTGARRGVSTGTRSFDKRSSETNSIEKKSSIRKVKGRQNWGIINEFAPNVRLATMILLKQKRQNVRKRALKQFSKPSKKSSKRVKFAAKAATKTWESPGHNDGIQNLSASKKQNESQASTRHNVFFKIHHAKSQGSPKRKKEKNTRNFINGRSDGFYINPRKAYLNRQFSPFDGMVNERRYEPNVDGREQFQTAQIQMAERMREMRSRGLFHSLGNINPQFFSRAPFRYPAMPMPQQFVAMQRYGLPARTFPIRYSRTPFPQTQNYFGTPWNAALANSMRGAQVEESDNVGVTPQDSYDQESVQPNTEENNALETSSQVDSGKLANSYQSPITEQTSQILKIEDNKAFEGHPIVNTENIDASGQGVYGKTNPRMTGMQVTDESPTTLNKWFPVRTGKVSPMNDPRTFSSQWPSGLPGLDIATGFNNLRARGYFPAMNTPATFNRFYYQNNEQSLQPEFVKEENTNNVASNGNNIDESNTLAFNRGYQIPFSSRLMMQRFGMSGTSGEGYFPNPYPTFPFTNFPYSNFPNRGNYKRRVLNKRELRHGKNSSEVPRGKAKLFNGPSSDGKKRSHNSSFNNSITSQSANYTISKVNKAAGKTHAHSSESNIPNKKTVSKHSMRIRKKEKLRSTRNFVNAENHYMYPRTPPNVYSFTPFDTVASDPRTRLMYPQLQTEDLMNDFKRKGYSVASGSFSDFPALTRRWPAVGGSQLTQRSHELSFPVGPPQSLMELSQKVDQFPAQEFVSSGTDLSTDTQTQASNVNDGHSSAPQARDYQPNTVSAALNLFSPQEPLDSSNQPSMRKARGEPSAETETEQKRSEIVRSPSRYSLGVFGFSQSAQEPPQGGVPEFPEQSSSQRGVPEYPEESSPEFSEGTQGIQENEFQGNRQGFAEGVEAYSPQEDDGAQDVPGESESDVTSGLLDGLDNAQASLLKQHIGNFAPMKGVSMGNFPPLRSYQKGWTQPPPANILSPAERQKEVLRQNAIARQKALLQQRATFSTKGNIQGNILGGTAPGRLSHRLRLPNLSLNTIEKLIDSETGEQSKDDYSTGVHDYGSSSKGPAAGKIADENVEVQDSSEQTGVSDWNVHNSPKENGKYVHNFDWKSPLTSHSQAPFNFNWKLERALTQWKEPTNSNRDTANPGETLSDSPPENVFVPPKGSNNNPDVVPGYTFDTQGQRSGPLFLPNPPPELEDDSSAETVLMVPASGNKLKGEAGAKKETISKKRSQRKTKAI
ncbi:hypothetical protein OS493_002357 [Desmophyllum pertusum]|uniref:External alternative NADH-ubiquinone oxidoreductase-like C-terminal domain-containing protein n=1 Tax=Desmophyllum pertusum TaxID=174260 RepID=A0A9W9YST3_9CNID|nr:hypothetical protein OS493_002357 [Desmophyllum pertusum]